MTGRLLLSMDVEASGPVPGLGDMISFAAVVVEPGLERQWQSGVLMPTCTKYSEGAYRSIGMSREEHEASRVSIPSAMRSFVAWVRECSPGTDRAVMLSDNPGFDFQWVNYWLHHCEQPPVLGHSARRIGDAWAGLRKRPRETQSWRRYRVTAHTHDPLDDCVGNAEAWLEMWKQHG